MKPFSTVTSDLLAVGEIILGDFSFFSSSCCRRDLGDLIRCFFGGALCLILAISCYIVL